MTSAGSDSSESADSREGLMGIVDNYLDALVTHDPAAVPIAPDAAFVENLERKPPGEGLWRTASQAPNSFKIYVPDPVTGQVGFLGHMQANGDPLLLGLRLAVEDGQLTEMEHLIATDETETLGELETPRPAFREPVPPEERNTREEMLSIAASYYDALAEDDGSLAPFAEDSVRFENGMQRSDNPSSPEADPADVLRTLSTPKQLDCGSMSYIERIEPRRVDIADVETGLVCGLSHFRHPMEETTLDIEGVPGVETVERDYDPFDLPALHVFKVYGGQIHEIEAMGFLTDYDAPTGWE